VKQVKELRRLSQYMVKVQLVFIHISVHTISARYM